MNNISSESVSTPSYSALAAHYDSALGQPFFLILRESFEKLAKRYSLTFDSAADLGCGTGLFARYLYTTRKIPVVAVDLSAAMLKEAARNCRGLNIDFQQQDLRTLSLPRKVDLVTVNFDTLNHLLKEEDLRRALKCIRDSLNARGHLFFDLITNCDPLGGATNVLVRRFHVDGYRLRQFIRWDPLQSLILTSVAVISPGKSEQTIESHVERAYSLAEISDCLTATGFAIRGVHHANTLRTIKKVSSSSSSSCPPRIIIVATTTDNAQAPW